MTATEFIESIRAQLETLVSTLVRYDIEAQNKPKTQIYNFADYLKKGELQQKEKQHKNGVLQFSAKEIRQMPKEFAKRKAEALNRLIREKPNGVIEIRTTYKGVAISASSKIFAHAKDKFIKSIIEVHLGKVKQITKLCSFMDFSKKWLETSKKPFVSELTYKNELILLNNHIRPFFDELNFEDITPMLMQPFFNDLSEAAPRTAQKTKQLLHQIFDAAINEELVTKNPVKAIRLPRHEYNNGTALTLSEEKTLLESVSGKACELDIIFLLYTGIRRGELATVVIGEDFITVRNGKLRKGQKQTTRLVPITPMLRKHIDRIKTSELFRARRGDNLTRDFKTYCPSHHLHELRHTYISRCQECSVSRELVSVWAGHAADRTMTTKVYTHFSPEYQLREAEKVSYQYE